MQWTQQWKEGFLVKRGAIRHNWLRRWFMLRDEFLFYYEAKGKKSKGKRFRFMM
jgi:hypothetical protein